MLQHKFTVVEPVETDERGAWGEICTQKQNPGICNYIIHEAYTNLRTWFLVIPFKQKPRRQVNASPLRIQTLRGVFSGALRQELKMKSPLPHNEITVHLIQGATELPENPTRSATRMIDSACLTVHWCSTTDMSNGYGPSAWATNQSTWVQFPAMGSTSFYHQIQTKLLPQ